MAMNEKISKEIVDAWETLDLGVLPGDHEEAMSHTSGDTLADYLVIEFCEGTEADDGTDSERMIAVAEKAIENLEQFIRALWK